LAKPKVFVAGAIGLDTVKTPFGSVENEIGGSAVFASLACSIFAKPAMFGIIGSDFPRERLKVLERKGIDLSGLQESQKPNMKWKAHYGFDINLAQTDSFEENALADLNPTVPEELKKSEFALIGTFDPASQLKLLNSFSKKPLLSVSDTIEHWIKNKRSEVLQMVKEAGIALMNDIEARMLFKTPSIVKAAQEILKLDSEFAIIKKGEHGCAMFSRHWHFFCPGYPLENVKDPTGCGDSFAGALVGYLAKTGEISEKGVRKAIVAASAVASFNAESFSFYRLAEISKKDVAERVKEFREIAKF
jgi:sugar/nucleoside kinase (ribokinase family)